MPVFCLPLVYKPSFDRCNCRHGTGELLSLPRTHQFGIQFGASISISCQSSYQVSRELTRCLAWHALLTQHAFTTRTLHTRASCCSLNCSISSNFIAVHISWILAYPSHPSQSNSSPILQTTYCSSTVSDHLLKRRTRTKIHFPISLSQENSVTDYQTESNYYDTESVQHHEENKLHSSNIPTQLKYTVIVGSTNSPALSYLRESWSF